MSSDHRQVVLLKSQHTLNRFYTLAPPERGWKNAEEIDDFPPDVLLGIAYPCLEDGLNDFAVIRSTFETLDSFPDDQELRDDLMVMVFEARDTLHRRLSELRDRLESRQAHFLGTDLNEFKDYAVTLATKGNIRRTLDNMMKLDVYESVALKEAEESGTTPDSMYYYEFLPENTLDKTRDLPPLEFVVRLFNDVLTSAEDENSYQSKYHFDKYVFQKFIALMFINYATTDPIFYGTNKADYGVSAGKDMSETPLYIAVGEALREIERQLAEDPNRPEEEITKATMHTHPTFGHEMMEGAAGEEESPSPWDELDLTPQGSTEEVLSEPAAAFEAPPFDLSTQPSPADSPAQEGPYPPLGPGVGPTAPPAGSGAGTTRPPAPPPTAVGASGGTPDGRTLHLPNASVTHQRLMVPLNSITMAVQLLKNSSDPMASAYAQMLQTSADALQAALKEWGILEE
ncbi:MAG: hypothetical protein KY468_02435 [Armatimonadetes bacterium]|nr:hypothetical protein [Armatimonadota bacterium]